MGLWAAQAFTRNGFRPTFHPMSLLALGDGGWVQVTAFVVSGLLVVGGSVGLRRVLDAGWLTAWATALVALMGAGLVVAGVFVTDAGAGFPEGAPAGAPSTSWHGAIHQVGFVLTQLAFVALGVVLAVRFRRSGQRRVGRRVRRGRRGGGPRRRGRQPGDAGDQAGRQPAIELGLVSALSLGSLTQRVR